MTGDPVERLQGILRGTIDAGFELKARHGFGPAVGSQGREERVCEEIHARYR